MTTLNATTDESDRYAGDGMKQTGYHNTCIILEADACPETHFNLTTLLGLLDLPNFKYPIKFVADNKALNICFGLSPGNSTYMCPYCTGCRYDAQGKRTNKVIIFSAL